MPVTTFEVGAAFFIEDRATAPLLEIGQAFTRLNEQATALRDNLSGLGDRAFTGLKASIDRAYTEVDRLIVQAAELGRAWESAGRMGGFGGRGGRGGGGGGGGASPYGPPDRPYWGEGDDWANAHWENLNENQKFARAQQLAQMENNNRLRQELERANGTYGPPDRPYWGENDDWSNAHAEARMRDDAETRRNARGGWRGSEMADQVFGIAEAVTLKKAFVNAGDEQQSLMSGVKAFGLDPTSTDGIEALALLREAARTSATGTSYKEFQTAAGIPLLARPFGLEGLEGVRQFSRIYPDAARAAEAMQLLDPHSTFEASLPAQVEFSHMNRQYDPEQLRRQYDLAGIIAGMVPHTTFAAEVGAQAYVVPLARAAGMSTEHAAMLVGSLQQAGLRGTIASTTLRQELVGLTRGGGPMQAHTGDLHGDVAEFEHAITLSGKDGKEAMEKLKTNDHITAMKEVGLLDAAGNQRYLYTAEDAARDPTGQIKKGGINVDRANEIFAQWSVGQDPVKVLEAGYKLFGIRGEMAPTILGGIIESGQPDFVKRFQSQVMSRLNTPGGYLATSQEQMATGFMQQSAQVGARFNDILGKLADVSLPAFQAALSNAVLPVMDAAAKALSPDQNGNYSLWQRVLGPSAIGALTGGATGAGLGFLFGGGPAGVIPGAIGGAVYGGGAGGGGALTYELLKRMRDHPEYQNPEFGGMPITARLPGPRIANLPAAQQSQPQINVGGITITNTGIGENDPVFQKLVRDVMDAIMGGLKGALSTGASEPKGSHESVYTGPGAGMTGF
jgi:hypothetical protein